jgi:hypothetical protein
LQKRLLRRRLDCCRCGSLEPCGRGALLLYIALLLFYWCVLVALDIAALLLLVFVLLAQLECCDVATRVV